jgi:aspartate aminotransferase
MVEKSRLDLMKRRDQIYRGLKDIPGVDLNLPQGAFYAWVDISKCLGKKIKNTEVVIDSSNTFSAELLERVGVAMVPGAEFGMEGYGRISFAVSPAKIEDAIKRIRRFSTDLMEG